MKNTLKHILTIFILLTTANCGSEQFASVPPDPKPSINLKKPNLTKAASCEDLTALIQQKEIAQLEKTRASYTSCRSYYGMEDSGAMASPASQSSASTASDTTNYTSTNVQETNVDETDIIKTNGTHIFVATSKGVDVFQAWPLAEFGKIKSIAIEDGVSQLILYQNVLIALSNKRNIYYPTETMISSYETSGSSEIVTVSTIDIQNPDDPQIIDQNEIPGYLLNTRLINGVLHIATNRNGFHWTSIDYSKLNQVLYSANCNDKLLVQTVDQLITEAKEKIMAKTWEDVIPEDLDCNDVMIDTTDDINPYNFLTGLTSIDLDYPDTIKNTFVLGYASDVYASENSFYLLGTNYDYDTNASTTSIHRFILDQDDTLHEYFTSGSVEGSYINSFSLSEYKGALRVATQIGDFWDASESRVTILDANTTGLPVLGTVTGLGKNERLYGVRFFEDRGYVVTYKKIDPLYVLDLSDPKNPAIKGELKMPGFSTYLHWLDKDHIIGLGKDAEEVAGANFSWFQGLKLAIFDVSDATKPAVSDELLTGGRGTTSYALDDHHAFTFDAQSGTLALPITFYEKSNRVNSYGAFGYQGVHIYQIDATNGITEDAIISLPNNASTPKRTIMISGVTDDQAEEGLFVMDDTHLYLFDMTDNYRLSKTEELDHEVYWNGFCGTDMMGIASPAVAIPVP